MITTNNLNNRYSVEQFNQQYTIDSADNKININSNTPNPVFKILPKPGQIVLAGNFRLSYTDQSLQIHSFVPMVQLGEAAGEDAPHGSINYLEQPCSTKHLFVGRASNSSIPPSPGAPFYDFNKQLARVLIEEVYSTTSNFPIYLKVEVELNLPYLKNGGGFDPTSRGPKNNLSIDLDFDLMQ